MIFTDLLVQEIAKHAADPHSSAPLFIYAAYQSVHGPLEVPRRFFDLYKDQGAESNDCLWANQNKGFQCKNGKGHGPIPP
eukprot:gene31111-12787_t